MVPQFGFAFKNLGQLATQFVHILSNQYVRSQVNRYRALGIIAQRQAGHPQEGCFFLDASRICDDDRSALLQSQELDVWQRFQQVKISNIYTKCRHTLACPRVNRENNIKVSIYI